MKRLLVTGGCGFLGSNFLRLWHRRYPRSAVSNVDCLTYAGGADNPGKICTSPVYVEHRIDITRQQRLRAIWPKDPVTVVHFAAETHVDRSLLDAQPFVRANVLGTHSILESARMFPVERVIIISTDEVYGPTPPRRKFKESQALNPTNPYAASKASADMLALSYQRTYDIPVIILRSVNAYGPRQYPEKFIPFFITRALAGQSLPLYGDGRQQRDWLWPEDFGEAVRLLIVARRPRQRIYHIAAGNHRRNMDVARAIIRLTGCAPDLLRRVADRPGHDLRYALEDTLFRNEFGWAPKTTWREGLQKTVEWYRENTTWVKKRLRRSFFDYYRRQYRWRLHG
ncbi:dTDP-glucose 4,6-dehydratase [Candidatus Zixiibacteriota bacterium]